MSGDAAALFQPSFLGFCSENQDADNTSCTTRIEAEPRAGAGSEVGSCAAAW